MNATGLPVPETAIQELGSSRKPAVTVTIGTYSYRSTVSSRQGGYILPLSSHHRAASGLSAGDEVVVTLELDQSPREIEVPLDLAEALSQRAVGIRCPFRVAPRRSRAPGGIGQSH